MAGRFWKPNKTPSAVTLLYLSSRGALIAATIFLFGLAARLMPVLSRAEPSEAHLSR